MQLRKYLVRSVVIGASVSTLGIGSAVVQRAVAADADPLVNACRHSVTGRLRWVSTADACRSSEKPISWNQQGPAGPPGPKGDPGAGMTKLNDLDGLACTRDDGKAGKVDLEIAADGDVTILCVAGSSPPPPPPGGTKLVVNEIDYDIPGTDGAGFVELRNNGTDAIDLGQLALVFVDGADGAEYHREALTGSLAAGAYVVADFDAQNGAPDGVAIVNTTTKALVDALSYEGEITSATIDGQTYNLVEGTALASSVADSNTVAGSLIRNPDGKDANDAAADWAFTTTITKGAANVLTGP
jgi:hypothetical protein